MDRIPALPSKVYEELKLQLVSAIRTGDIRVEINDYGGNQYNASGNAKIKIQQGVIINVQLHMSKCRRMSTSKASSSSGRDSVISLLTAPEEGAELFECIFSQFVSDGSTNPNSSTPMIAQDGRVATPRTVVASPFQARIPIESLRMSPLSSLFGGTVSTDDTSYDSDNGRAKIAGDVSFCSCRRCTKNLHQYSDLLSSVPSTPSIFGPSAWTVDSTSGVNTLSKANDIEIWRDGLSLTHSKSHGDIDMHPVMSPQPHLSQQTRVGSHSEIQINHLLLCGNDLQEPTLRLNLTQPLRWHKLLLPHQRDELATNPPQMKLDIICPTLRPLLVQINETTFLTVWKVLKSICDKLMRKVSAEELGYLSEQERILVNKAYERRYREWTIAGRYQADSEKKKGVRRVDLLLEENCWMGLCPTANGPTIWELKVADRELPPSVSPTFRPKPASTIEITVVPPSRPSSPTPSMEEITVPWSPPRPFAASAPSTIGITIEPPSRPCSPASSESTEGITVVPPSRPVSPASSESTDIITIVPPSRPSSPY